MMISNTIYFDPNNSLEIQGINDLKRRSKVNDPQTQREVAGQFESMLVHLLIKNMREASQSLTEDEEKSDQLALYQDLFDNQIAVLASQHGMGLSQQIEAYLNRMSPQAIEQDVMKSEEEVLRVVQPAEPTKLPHEVLKKGSTIQKTDPSAALSAFNNPADFVEKIWGYAKKAADTLGVDPKLLIAQVALETGWGQRILEKDQGSTYNLFNIKAGQGWHKETLVMDALESKDGLFVKERSAFKRYGSFEESFSDYVQLIQRNPRYSEAMQSAADPDQYMISLQKAQYASDPQYAQKVLAIYKGDRLKNLFEKI